MTTHRKHPDEPGRPRPHAEWRQFESSLTDEDLYVGGRPLTAWEMHRASLLVLVVLACLLAAWLLWGGRG